MFNKQSAQVIVWVLGLFLLAGSFGCNTATVSESGNDSGSKAEAGSNKDGHSGDDPSATAKSDGTSSIVQGVDVSHYSGDVDWQTVRAEGKLFGIAKATQGTDFTDPMFATNWAGMKAAKVIRGAYCFYDVDADPALQARLFIKTVTLEPGDLPPVLDVETAGSKSGEALAKSLQIWLDLVEAHYGVKPMINTDPSFWNSEVNASFSQYPLWVSNTEVEEPTLPYNWTDYVIWQYVQNTSLNGVPSDVDLDQFNGGLEALLKFVIAEK